MRAFRSAFFFVAPAIFSLGGCPTSETTLFDALDAEPQSASSVSEEQLTSNPGRTVAGSADASDATFSSQLEARFPACDEPSNAQSLKIRILELVNAERSRNGLSGVKWNDTLEHQAEQYACELIQFDFFAHDNPVTGSSLGDRSREFGYEFQVVGENLAAGQQTPEQAFADWLQSPGHRRNILDPRFTELGVGVKSGGDYGLYWVQEFGTPLK